MTLHGSKEALIFEQITSLDLILLTYDILINVPD